MTRNQLIEELKTYVSNLRIGNDIDGKMSRLDKSTLGTSQHFELSREVAFFNGVNLLLQQAIQLNTQEPPTQASDSKKAETSETR